VTALAAASTASHLLGRMLRRRERPRAAHLAARRALGEAPTSSSFPSSHTTCAVAVATALALENPVFGVAVAPAAGVVAYARVRTRVHWPTDVVAGALPGAITAVATRRLPPSVSRASGTGRGCGPAGRGVGLR